MINKEEFNEYITPTDPISTGASDITGIYFDEETNEMVHNGVVVHHSPPSVVLNNFISFLQNLKVKHIVLVAHNNKAFYSQILHNQMVKYNLWFDFCSVVSGFCDSLPFFKSVYL